MHLALKEPGAAFPENTHATRGSNELQLRHAVCSAVPKGREGSAWSSHTARHRPWGRLGQENSGAFFGRTDGPAWLSLTGKALDEGWVPQPQALQPLLVVLVLDFCQAPGLSFVGQALQIPGCYPEDLRGGSPGTGMQERCGGAHFDCVVSVDRRRGC